MEILGTKEQLKAVKSIVANMIANGQAFEAREPVWKAGPTLATAPRSEGKIQFDGSQIVFTNLPKEFADLNGKGLRLKGRAPIVRICIADAVMDWKPDEKMIAEAKAAGRKLPTPIKKGDQMIRCFA